jgi:hypothetical protein
MIDDSDSLTTAASLSYDRYSNVFGLEDLETSIYRIFPVCRLVTVNATLVNAPHSCVDQALNPPVATNWSVK